MLPLSLLRSMNSLRFSSFFGVCSIAYLVVAALIHATRNPAAFSGKRWGSEAFLGPGDFVAVVQAVPVPTAPQQMQRGAPVQPAQPVPVQPVQPGQPVPPPPQGYPQQPYPQPYPPPQPYPYPYPPPPPQQQRGGLLGLLGL